MIPARPSKWLIVATVVCSLALLQIAQNLPQSQHCRGEVCDTYFGPVPSLLVYFLIPIFSYLGLCYVSRKRKR